MNTVNGYRIVSDWTTAGGGMCKWAFAEKNGKPYFIKQFLRPTYPLPDGPGSPAMKAKRKNACDAFESHHKSLLKSLSGLASGGGHLIVTREFFRVDAKYYKVTDRIDTASLSVSEISRIEPRARVILALTIVHSLEILHRQGIVHGDLKPDNILPKLASKDVYAAKLIDFDDSYREGEPPPPDEVVGDFTYYSPELLLYIQGEGEGKKLSYASDIFALGVVLAQYFSGKLPDIVLPAADSKPAGTIAQAVIRGQELRTGLATSWPDMDQLLLSMIQLDPAARPPISDVAASLKRIRDLETKGARRSSAKDSKESRTSPSKDEPSPSETGPRLKGKGLSIGRATAAPDTPDDSPKPTPALRGKLVSPRKDST